MQRFIHGDAFHVKGEVQEYLDDGWIVVDGTLSSANINDRVFITALLEREDKEGTASYVSEVRAARDLQPQTPAEALYKYIGLIPTDADISLMISSPYGGTGEIEVVSMEVKNQSIELVGHEGTTVTLVFISRFKNGSTKYPKFHRKDQV